MVAVDRFGDVVRQNLPGRVPDDGPLDAPTGGRSVVVDPDGLVDLAGSVIHHLHQDAERARTRLRDLAREDRDIGPDEHAQRLSGVVAEALQVYLAWSREIERLLQDFQDGMVAAATEWRGADDAAEVDLRRRSTAVFADHVHVPADRDGDGRLDAVEDHGREALDRHRHRHGDRDGR